MSSIEETIKTEETTTTTSISPVTTTTQVSKDETSIAASSFSNLTTASTPVVSDTIKTEEAEGEDNEVLLYSMNF